MITLRFLVFRPWMAIWPYKSVHESLLEFHLSIFVLSGIFNSLSIAWFQLKDLASFAVILFVFVFAYGVAQQAILYPNEPATMYIFVDIFRKSYWQMYGELFLEEIEGEMQTASVKCLAHGVILTCNNVSSIGLPNLLLRSLCGSFLGSFQGAKCDHQPVTKHKYS